MSALSDLRVEDKPIHDYILKTARSESMNIFEGMNELRSS